MLKPGRNTWNGCSNYVPKDVSYWPDRTPHPCMYEFKKLAQPLKVEALNLETGTFRITNRHWATSIDETWGFHMKEFDNITLMAHPKGWSYDTPWNEDIQLPLTLI